MSTAASARVALLQLPAFSIEDAEASLTYTLARIDDAMREQPDLIVLPEVTYPAYFMGTTDLSGSGVLSPSEAMARFSAKAREHGVYLAAGLALDAPDAGYTNGAALFARDGALVGQYAKSFLWHFDNRWFTAGDAYPVFELEIGRVGMMICADGRVPEIARSLMLNGAQLILDLTAWVSGGRQTEDLTTAQRQYLMQVRAAENGVWIACADKCGTEAESIVYAGGSCFISPQGEYAMSLGPSESGILVHDVPMRDATPRMDRRPELYEALTQPTESLPVIRTLGESFGPADAQHRIAAVQMTMPPTGAQFLAQARRHVCRLAMQDAELVLFPATPGRLRPQYEHDAVLAGMLALSSETGVCIAFTVSEPDAGGWRAMYLLGPKGVLAKHRQTHKGRGPRFATMPMGDEVCPVVHTPIGRVGLLAGTEGFVPEVARSLMLRGAEILLWSNDDPPRPMEMIARCRADENRVFVACAGAPTANGAAMIADPTGAILAIALAGRELAVAADINRSLSHLKQRAPGTDVVRNRQPATYGAIVAQPVPVGAG